MIFMAIIIKTKPTKCVFLRGGGGGLEKFARTCAKAIISKIADMAM